MSTTYFYDPRNGHGLRHDPFKAIVAPRPIGWISTVDAEGRVNLAPYSFFNGFNTSPPIVGFASEGRKHSLANVRATGEFVCNLVTRDLADAMNVTSATFPAGVDEMVHAGLEAAPCVHVRAPRVARSPAALECKLLQIVQLHDLDRRALETFLMLGQVVGVHIDTDYLVDGVFDTGRAHPIARCGGRGAYAAVEQLFELVRPTVPPVR